MTPSDPLETRLASLELSPEQSTSVSEHRPAPSIHSLDLDLTLSTAVSQLINHLLQPINRLYPSSIISDLRLRLTNSLTELYAPTWNASQPQQGSGFRSLICTKQRGLPKVLLESAREAGVDPVAWKRALNKVPEEDVDPRLIDEWEAWCDPGTVVWRQGPWDWEDPEFDPIKGIKAKYQIIWSSSSSPKPVAPTANHAPTPARTSHAIPIRAPVPLPAVFAIPPTPANQSTSTVPKPASPLLPPASISRTPSPSPSDSSYGSSKIQSRSSSNAYSHRGTDSTSSQGSSDTDQTSHQLLTPQTRPPSVDNVTSDKSATSVTPTQRGRTPPPGSAVSVTPTVTPYDGGNVTVLGGGVKLGGMSRPASVMSLGRNTDRSRSPSVSLAARALSSALGPNGQPARKTRTRRRIMPTYLGRLQPGVGSGPMGSSFVPAIQPWQTSNMGVGVGVAPPPIPAMSRPLGNPRVASI